MNPWQDEFLPLGRSIFAFRIQKAVGLDWIQGSSYRFCGLQEGCRPDSLLGLTPGTHSWDSLLGLPGPDSAGFLQSGVCHRLIPPLLVLVRKPLEGLRL